MKPPDSRAIPRDLNELTMPQVVELAEAYLDLLRTMTEALEACENDIGFYWWNGRGFEITGHLPVAIAEELSHRMESEAASPAPPRRDEEVPPHVFEAFDGASGRACTKMVLRSGPDGIGYGEDCGLPPDHPKHALGVRYIEEPGATHFIYTDGACDREGYGAWAWVSEHGSQCGNEYPTTNNRMELQAAIMALSSGFLPDDVTIVTDSAYVSNCFLERWYDGWRQNGWINSKKKPVDNRDLWEELLALVESWQGELNWLHVRGHGRGKDDDPTHVEGNRQADELAVSERIFGRKHRERLG